MRKTDDLKPTDARRAKVRTRAPRLSSTQIINLTQLAPDIQEAILDLEPTTDHVPRFRERAVRTIAIMPNWEKQRVLWKRLVKLTAISKSSEQ